MEPGVTLHAEPRRPLITALSAFSIKWFHSGWIAPEYQGSTDAAVPSLESKFVPVTIICIETALCLLWCCTSHWMHRW